MEENVVDLLTEMAHKERERQLKEIEIVFGEWFLRKVVVRGTDYFIIGATLRWSETIFILAKDINPNNAIELTLKEVMENYCE